MRSTDLASIGAIGGITGSCIPPSWPPITSAKHWADRIAVIPRDRWPRIRHTEASVHEYELLVVGSGPGGQRAAIAAAKMGRRVAVVDRKGMVGGVCVNTGTIPSKTMREAVLFLTGM